MTESKAQKAIVDKMNAIEPGTERWEALNVARRFKTSWVELGGKLFEIRKKKLFEEWGFGKFDDYSQNEIKIKPRTAAKLTASYGFLKKEEPSVLKRDGVKKPMPDVQVIDLLRRIREKEEVPEAEYKKIKDMALADFPVAEVRKELKPYLAPKEPPTADQLFRRFVAQATRLAEGLAAAKGVPAVIIDRALSLVDDLRVLIKN